MFHSPAVTPARRLPNADVIPFGRDLAERAVAGVGSGPPGSAR